MTKSAVRFLSLAAVLPLGAAVFLISRSTFVRSPFATNTNRPHREKLLTLAEERRIATVRLADFLEAPKRGQIFRRTDVLKLDDESDFAKFEVVQNAITYEVAHLVAQTAALADPSQKADAQTTYGRKVIAAQNLLRDIQRAELQMEAARALLQEARPNIDR